MLTKKELLLIFESKLRMQADENGMVSMDTIQSMVSTCIYEMDNEPKPVEKFIFVEDGSVDADELMENLSLTNPEIRVVVYRQGARSPELVDVKEG